MDRQACEEAVRGYYAVLDAYDLEGIMGRLADGIVFELEPDGVRVAGRDEVRAVYRDLLAGCRSMRHELLQVAVDAGARTVAAEVVFHSTRADGSSSSLRDVNWFELDAGGRIVRGVFWLGHDESA